jgi:histidine ammonia-lyase
MTALRSHDTRSRKLEAGRTIRVGDRPLTIEDIISLSGGAAKAELADAAKERMQKSWQTVQQIHARSGSIYGVTTSVGASVTVPVPPEHSDALSLNLMRFHGCGTGRLLEPREAAAVLAVRLAALARGCSGIRPIVAERIVTLLKHKIVPQIPAEGSVGASGDLTPLSYVAAVLAGEREVFFDGRPCSAKEALEAIGCEPLALQAKESLALMNGTAVATALSCLAWHGAWRLARLSALLTAMTSRAIDGRAGHFDAFIHQIKPHQGQIQAAAWIRQDVGSRPPEEAARLQDRYSVRCGPHVLGVLIDALSWTKRGFDTELNSVSDNPVVDVERGVVLHGGNFYGGHVGFYCDALKIAVASVADLLDRQLLLLCSPAENGGLPRDLVGVEGPEACAHNGFKAMTISASALAAEALKLTMPATSFSRSTELHNQDKVPMATIAARDLARVVELTEQVAAIVVLANCQALDLRGGYPESENATALHRAVRGVAHKLQRDRRMDHDIAAVLALLREDKLPLDDAYLGGDEASEVDA